MSILGKRPQQRGRTNRVFWLALASVLIAPAAALTDDQNANEAASAAIRANVDAFVKAYNAGDAKAIADLFTPEGQLIDENDKTTQGRKAIQHAFASVFALSPQGRVEVTVASIRFFGSALAIETGSTKVVASPGDDPDVTHYTVVHTKSLDGKWLMTFARDTPVAESESAMNSEAVSHAAQAPANSAAKPVNSERLKPLSWLVGDWIDEGDDSIVISSCKWSADKNYLLQNIEVRSEGRDALIIRQRVGWDPLAGRIRAWLFDSNGGFGESFWTQEGRSWRLKSTGVRPDGTKSSSTDIITPTSKDSYTWQSTDRVVGTQKRPSVEVKVVRKPPEVAK
jgi:uncharacterized protein (TIGR02246 family)